MTPAPLIHFQSVSKRFPGVQALHCVELPIAAGSCHALVGENGAGKSTLGKILAGLHTPDEGRLLIDGRPCQFHSPHDAARAGVAMVHQELLFCENLCVAENLSLGRLPARATFLRRRRMEQLAAQWLEPIDARIDPRRRVGELPVSQQQLVQIAAAIGRGARILVFDEPTSSLAHAESERLFDLIARLRRRGVTMIYVSHRMDEIFRLCDTISVLRDGRHVATRPAAEYDRDSLVHDMIGRPVSDYFPGHLAAQPGEELLRVEGLSSPGRFHDISFSLRRGEVLGLAGLVGAGRTELAEALFGLDPHAVGRVWLKGRPLALGRPRRALERGLGLVPEDRKRHGLVLSLRARENITLPILPRLSRLTWVRRRAERRLAREFFDRLSVRAPSLETPARSLSGGNQQKLVIARWLAARCDVLIVDEPTRGVDVGAKAEIHGLIDRVARDGNAVLLISSELPEVLNLSTRILVLREGQLAGELSRDAADQAALLRLMARLD
ncbi:MAG TPA: sugar ABC transporter ATP-binding protein [Candidatus Sumerlaeota bacterium]|nr:sugar ABC transporter ATP-binding protein [Candidatus Sumerlaeota bacterium]